jgi:hypothetical protein
VRAAEARAQGTDEECFAQEEHAAWILQQDGSFSLASGGGREDSVSQDLAEPSLMASTASSSTTESFNGK